MSAESHPIRFDSSVLEQLACPVCQGTLALAGTRLICAACGRAYPIIDGIPVLIPGREENLRQ